MQQAGINGDFGTDRHVQGGRGGGYNIKKVIAIHGACIFFKMPALNVPGGVHAVVAGTSRAAVGA